MVLEETSKCTGCGRPRFTPGLCKECQEKTGLTLAMRNTTQAYNLVGEASDLLTGIYDHDSIRVDEIANKLSSAQEDILKTEHQIRELQTQLLLQKGISEEQEKKLEEVRLYAKELRFSHQHISYSLRNILKLDGEPWT
jgi:TolA-binding protein